MGRDGVERVRVEAAGSVDRLPHVTGFHVQMPGKFGDSGITPQGLRQLGLRAEKPRAQILDVPRRPDHPTAVPQVPFQFAGDGGSGVRGKTFTFAPVEALRSLHEAEVSHLVEVRPFPAAGLEPGGERFGKIQIIQDQPVLKRFPEPSPFGSWRSGRALRRLRPGLPRHLLKRRGQLRWLIAGKSRGR
ncbi:hypothetical protein GCM10009712_23080 [Pseudarthrobacter sulfonivorans]